MIIKDIKPIVKKIHEGEICYHEDPMKSLIERDLAIQVGSGLFVLKGILVNILNKIESLICEIAENVGAEHVSVPSILSWENAKSSKYLNSFKNQALMIKSFENNIKQNSSHSEYEGMTSPTVCYHYFSSLKNKSVDHNYSITAISKCTRKEKGKLNNLSRLTNFTMREIVFYGTEKYCLEKRKEVLNATLKMLDSVLDLSYKIVTASDAFFGENSEIKKKAQMISKSKYELQGALPFSKTFIALASFNHHGRVFYDRFNIAPKKPELTFSGCVGWGYERMLYTILAQKGTNFSSSYYKNLLKER